jgi:hypothetical protein
MKRLLLLLVILISAISAHSQTLSDAAGGLKVNGVGLGATYKEVIRKLGKPVKVTTATEGPCVEGKQRTVHYPGLTLELFEEDANKFIVGEFEVTSAKWSVSGAKVGMNGQAISRRFGKAEIGEADSYTGGPIWYYEIDDEAGLGNSSFFFREGRVVRIYSAFMMC